MMSRHFLFKTLAIAASLTAGLALPARAQAMHLPGEGPRPEFALPGEHFPPGEGPLPPFLRGIELSESQRDQVFQLLHAQAPQIRQHAKALRQSREGLRALALSGQYDEARAQALAEAGARAQAALALLQARTDHELLALLTPEQRQARGTAIPAGQSAACPSREKPRH